VVGLCRACHALFHEIMGQQISPLPYKRPLQIQNAKRWLKLRPLGRSALPDYVREKLCSTGVA
jgi:hypothetical protein